MAESESFFVTVRMGEVEKISQAGEKRLGLRLFFGNSSASASTSDISQKVHRKAWSTTRSGWRGSRRKIRTADCRRRQMLARDLPELDLLDDAARSVSVDEKIANRPGDREERDGFRSAHHQL